MTFLMFLLAIPQGAWMDPVELAPTWKHLTVTLLLDSALLLASRHGYAILNGCHLFQQNQLHPIICNEKRKMIMWGTKARRQRNSDLKSVQHSTYLDQTRDKQELRIRNKRRNKTNNVYQPTAFACPLSVSSEKKTYIFERPTHILNKNKHASILVR